MLGASVLVTVGVFAALPHAQARPSYARRTGLACGVCHVNPEGGGPRTAFGRAFARNGHRLPGAASRSRSGGHRSEPGRHGMDGGMMGPGMMGPGMMDGDGR
jgi:hypothetical protein